jgi:hypothetical protein
MKEHPILFSGAMVNAILEGRKTQTRRVVKPQPIAGDPANIGCLLWSYRNYEYSTEGMRTEFIKDCSCPYGVPGDRLWVRETWRTDKEYNPYSPLQIDSGAPVLYTSDNGNSSIIGKIRPSIHMPRWASRITLDIASIRVERLQEISEDDSFKEGVTIPTTPAGSPLLCLTGRYPACKYYPKDGS